MIDTINENGLVPTRLVFGVIPRSPIISRGISARKEEMKILTPDQAEMNAIIAERKISIALTRDILPAPNRVYEMGEKVLVYSENEEIGWSSNCCGYYWMNDHSSDTRRNSPSVL